MSSLEFLINFNSILLSFWAEAVGLKRKQSRVSVKFGKAEYKLILLF